MNLFDQLVTEALKNQSQLSSLRTVVEKELLHHDILKMMSEEGLLRELTFMGGTCLRMCYGGIRLSEDLDFNAGRSFSKKSLSAMGRILIEGLRKKYGLPVQVSEPVKDVKNVNTWKIKVETKPQQKHLPAQRINIDVCAVPSYEKKPMLLINPYGVDMGTGGLIIQAQSREEIYADKLIAFALRPNRLKHRDIWDIVWMHQQGLKPNLALIPKKLQDRVVAQQYFFECFDQRKKLLTTDTSLEAEFKKEMHRFLPAAQIKNVSQLHFWDFIVHLIDDLGMQVGLSIP